VVVREKKKFVLIILAKLGLLAGTGSRGLTRFPRLESGGIFEGCLRPAAASNSDLSGQYAQLFVFKV